ncbi:amidase family protein [Nonomuraea sp. NPDC004297]
MPPTRGPGKHTRSAEGGWPFLPERGHTLSHVGAGEAEEFHGERGVEGRPGQAQPVVAAAPIVAPLLGQRELELDGRPVAVRPALLSLTSPWNVFGLPALTVPAGTVAGLPVGLQLVARPGAEARLFAVAAGVTAGA